MLFGVLCLFSNDVITAEDGILSHQELASLEKAERLFESAAYLEAIAIDNAILQNLNLMQEKNAAFDILKSKLMLRIFQSYFLLEQYEDLIQFASDHFEEGTTQHDDITAELLFLLATAHQRTEKYTEALSLFQKHNAFAANDESRFEYGKTLYLQGNFDKAFDYFVPVSQTSKENLRKHAIYYLTRIFLAQGRPLSALDYLAKVDQEDEEKSYLQGEAYFQTGDYGKAIAAFETVISQKESWYLSSLYYLGESYLKLAEDTVQDKQKLLTKAEQYFQKLVASSAEEKNYLLLLQCYLKCAKTLNDENFFLKAQDLLLKANVFSSTDSYTQALLLMAQAGNTYAARDRFYRLLTMPENETSRDYATGWYLRGVNDLEEAITLQKQQRETNALKLRTTSRDSFQTAWNLLQNLKKNEDVFYLSGLVASKLFMLTQELYWLEKAEDAFLSSFEEFPRAKYADLSLLLLGKLYLQNEKNSEALETFVLLNLNYPESPLIGEALFWSARSCEKLKMPRNEIKNYYRAVFQEYPTCLFAAEAYFRYYTYYEYLQGDRAALKHLQHFKEHYPNHPLLMNVMYLIGLDYKRDRKTPEGKWIRKKDLTATIDAFQEVESLFDHFEKQQSFTDEQLRTNISMRCRANFERALANLQIAQQSIGAKKKIYLEYAIDVFSQIIRTFENPSPLIFEELLHGEAFPEIYQESLFWMAKAYIEALDDKSAENVLSKMLEKYKTGKITRGYYLARTWLELGLIAKNRFEAALALDYFAKAEDASKGRVLNTDQILDLWIQQGLCYRDLDQMDTAMLVLSKVINEDAISPLRLKAMFLRAEIYEMQGRYELARKQLEAMSKKGGDWALKAKEKLEKNYGT